MKILLQQALHAVSILNEKCKDGMDMYRPFSYESDGKNCIISFMGISIWSDVDDARTFNEKELAYEPLEDYCMRESKLILDDLIYKVIPPINFKSYDTKH